MNNAKKELKELVYQVTCTFGEAQNEALESLKDFILDRGMRLSNDDLKVLVGEV